VATQGKQACPVCGTLFPDNSDSCPVCALRGALDNEPTVGESSVEPTLLGSQLRFEHYEILTHEDGTPVELGRGAMGVTYKAVDVNLRCTVALKVINARWVGDELARRRFVREARAAASVRHPNVASVFHLGKSAEIYFFAMEFVDGEPLGRLMRRSNKLEVKLALEIATQVAAGLAAIHEQKLVHRDIKPSNVMVKLKDNSPIAKIIDLGLAKAVPESQFETVGSIPGSFAGTPEFASPEQFAGIGIDIRSDLYSLGATLWNMLAGQPPFRGTSAELMHGHLHAPLPIGQLDCVPQPVIVLIEVLLEKDPVRRFQNPTQLLNAMPMISGAIDTGLTVTHQSLRQTATRAEASQVKYRPQREAAVNPLTISLPTAKGLERSVAVLPFETLSDNRNDAYFADGVQDEILSRLAKVSQLSVISRTSVMTYRPGGDRDVRSIASALGVANVVEGSVRRDGNRVRITIRLVDARRDEALWSDSYDRDLSDIFSIQSDIARKVASKLTTRLSPKERKEIREKPTKDLEAYDLYLRARELIVNSDWFQIGDEREGLLSAIRLLEEATRRDSKFALAFSLIARANDALYWTKIDQTPERRALADVAIDEALRLRPDLIEVRLKAAWRHFIYRDDERAFAELAIVQRSLPNSSEAVQLRAFINRRQGRWQEAIRALQGALSLDSRHPGILGSLGATYCWLRRYREVEQVYDRQLELAPDKTSLKAYRASVAFEERADLESYQAIVGKLPSATRNNLWITSLRFQNAVLARNWRDAREIVSDGPHNELYFRFSPWSWANSMVPRGCHEIWCAALQRRRPTMEARFGSTRDLLKQKAEAQSEDAGLISMLGLIDAALGRREEAIQEARRATETLPISKDAVEGPPLVSNLAMVYAWTNELDLAFQDLTISVKTPGGVHYGELKLDPAWDPLRDDPRFDKLLAELAPHD
jgi:serine/threonine protein kinase/Flp pilus assembly protein TadD